MTVGGPESRVEERELGCVRFSRTVCRLKVSLSERLRKSLSDAISLTSNLVLGGSADVAAAVRWCCDVSARGGGKITSPG